MIHKAEHIYQAYCRSGQGAAIGCDIFREVWEALREAEIAAEADNRTLRAEVERLTTQLKESHESLQSAANVMAGLKGERDALIHDCSHQQETRIAIEARLSQAQQALRWISVSEKLPELPPYLPYANCHGSICVEIWTIHHEFLPAAFCEKENGERWWEIDCPESYRDTESHRLALDKVTHWRPAPLPPEAALPSDAPEAAK